MSIHVSTPFEQPMCRVNREVFARMTVAHAPQAVKLGDVLPPHFVHKKFE